MEQSAGLRAIMRPMPAGPEDWDEDEADLVASLGDPQHFAGIFERRVDGVYRFLSFRAGREFAEELTAETFARAFAGRRLYRPERGSVRVWLYGIATNLVRHQRRDDRRRAAILKRAGSGLLQPVTDSAAQATDRVAVSEAVAALGPKLRDVALLIGVGGLTYEETAAVLGIPTGTVRSRYSRARQQLTARLADPAEPDLRGGAVP
jgi:RNA polymerase sigma factor (sigma-70 family)